MPQITDLEFDRVISECSRQLVVVSVYSSRHPEATPCDAMMEDISYGINYRLSLDYRLLVATFRLQSRARDAEKCNLHNRLENYSSYTTSVVLSCVA